MYSKQRLWVDEKALTHRFIRYRTKVLPNLDSRFSNDSHSESVLVNFFDFLIYFVNDLVICDGKETGFLCFHSQFV